MKLQIEGHASKQPERCVPQGIGRLPPCVWNLFYFPILLPTEKDPKESLSLLPSRSSSSVVCGLVGQGSEQLLAILPVLPEENLEVQT